MKLQRDLVALGRSFIEGDSRKCLSYLAIGLLVEASRDYSMSTTRATRKNMATRGYAGGEERDTSLDSRRIVGAPVVGEPVFGSRVLFCRLVGSPVVGASVDRS